MEVSSGWKEYFERLLLNIRDNSGKDENCEGMGPVRN